MRNKRLMYTVRVSGPNPVLAGKNAAMRTASMVGVDPTTGADLGAKRDGSVGKTKPVY